MPTRKNAASLTKLTSTVFKLPKSLFSLGMTRDMWDRIIVHYSRLSSLESFLQSRVRALERIESTQSPSTPSTLAKPSQKKSAHIQQFSAYLRGYTQKECNSTASQYQWDCCHSRHYGKLSTLQRTQLSRSTQSRD